MLGTRTPESALQHHTALELDDELAALELRSIEGGASHPLHDPAGLDGEEEEAAPESTQRPRVRPPAQTSAVLPLRSRATEELLGRRDPAMVAAAFRVLSAIVDRYFRAEVEGIENFGTDASLIVSTHNGGLVMPDLLALAVAFWRHHGIDARAYGLMHGLGFKVPGFGSSAVKLGAIEASRDNAAAVLRAGHPLLVCPGGDMDSLRPFSRRHEVSFGDRRGFIRLAIAEQVPIVPVVSVGAHEVFMVLNDGRWLAEVTGAARWLRLKSVPLALSFPLGLTIGGFPSIPLPAKVKVRVLPPIELGEDPAAASDDAVVERCFDLVRTRMQSALDELAAERRWPILG